MARRLEAQIGWNISQDASPVSLLNARSSFGILLSQGRMFLLLSMFQPTISKDSRDSSILKKMPPNNHSTPLHHDYTVSFVSQINQYITYGHATLSALPSAKKPLVAIFIGINDINDSSKYVFPYQNTTSFAQLYDAIITEQFTALERLYNVGYKDFLIMGLPPLELTVSTILLIFKVETRRLIVYTSLAMSNWVQLLQSQMLRW